MELARPSKISVHISLTERQIRIVSREAKRQDITLQDFVRRVLDGYIDQQHLERDVPVR